MGVAFIVNYSTFYHSSCAQDSIQYRTLPVMLYVE